MDNKFSEDYLGLSYDPYSLNEEDIKLIRSYCIEKMDATGVDGKWCFDALNTTEINAIVKTAIILGGGDTLAHLPPANEIIRRYGDNVYRGVLLAWAEKNKWKIKAYCFGKKMVIVVIASIIILGVMYLFGLI